MSLAHVGRSSSATAQNTRKLQCASTAALMKGSRNTCILHAVARRQILVLRIALQAARKFKKLASFKIRILELYLEIPA